MINALKKLIALFMLFTLIYAVNIRPIYNYTLFLIFGLIYISFNAKSALYFFKKSLFPILFIFLAGVYGLIIDTDSINGSSYGIIAFRIIIECFLLSFVFSNIVKKWGIKIQFLATSIVGLGIIQLCFASYLLLNLENKAKILISTIGMTDDDLIINSFVGLYRGYGLTNHHLFAFSFVQGLIGAFSLFLFARTNSIRAKILLFFSFLGSMLVVVLNARIGFVPLIFSIFFISIFLIKYGTTKQVASLFFAFFFAASLLASSAIIFSENEAVVAAFARFNEGVDTITSTANDSNSEENNRDFFLDYLRFPSGLDFIFGRGVKLVDGIDFTDFGYQRYVYFGGVIYSLFIYTSFMYVFIIIFNKGRQLIKTHYEEENVNTLNLFNSFFILTVLSYLIAHIKGEIFTLNDSIRLLIIVYAICISYTRENIKSTKSFCN